MPINSKTGLPVPEKIPGMVSRIGRIKVGRQAAAEGQESDFTKTFFTAVLASENPAVVWDWEHWSIIREVLLMDGCEMPDSRQIVMLDRHSCYGAVKESVKGSFRNLRIEGVDLLGDGYFSSLAKDEFTLVDEGHLTDVSNGYDTYQDKTIILKAGEKTVYNGRTYENNYPDGLDLFIRTKWKPKECSLVPIGADENSKFREDMLSQFQQKIQELEKQLNGRSSIKIKENSQMPEPVERTPDQIREDERKRIADIEAYGKRFSHKLANADKVIRQAVNESWPVDRFRMYVMDNMDTSAPVETPGSEVGLTERQKKDFSVTRAIAQIYNKKWGEPSLEREASDQVAKNIGKDAQTNAFYLPSEIQMRLNPRVNTRAALSTATPAAGGYLVPQDYMGGSFIDFLRNKAVMPGLGMSVLSGLKGDIVIPKQLSATVFQMTGYGAADQSFMTFGQKTATPHYGSATTEYHKSLVLQADPSIEFLIVNDLFATAAVGIDSMVINGEGAANEPGGFMNETGIGAVDCSNGLSWAKIIEFKKKLKKANADQLGDIKFAMSPDVEELLLTTPKAGAYPVFLMADDGKVAACPSAVSNQFGDSVLAAGIWSEVVLCDWNLYEILVNPYGPNSKAGNIEVTIFAAFDVAIKRAAAIVASDNVALGE